MRILLYAHYFNACWNVKAVGMLRVTVPCLPSITAGEVASLGEVACAGTSKLSGATPYLQEKTSSMRGNPVV